MDVDRQSAGEQDSGDISAPRNEGGFATRGGSWFEARGHAAPDSGTAQMSSDPSANVSRDMFTSERTTALKSAERIPMEEAEDTGGEFEREVERHARTMRSEVDDIHHSASISRPGDISHNFVEDEKVSSWQAADVGSDAYDVLRKGLHVYCPLPEDFASLLRSIPWLEDEHLQSLLCGEKASGLD